MAGLFSLIGDTIAGFTNANAARDASGQLVAAGNQGLDATRQGYTSAMGNQQPYYDIGTQGARNLSAGVQGGDFNEAPSQFNYKQYQDPGFNFEQDPGYQFSKQQGLDAVQNSASARGSGLSGATMKALQRYGTNIANQEYGQAYNRYAQNRQFGAGQNTEANTFAFNAANTNYNQRNQQANQRYSRLSDLMGVGERAAGNLSNLNVGQGRDLSNIYGEIGNAQAAGTMGQANAYSKMYTNLGEGMDSMTSDLTDKLGKSAMSLVGLT